MSSVAAAANVKLCCVCMRSPFRYSRVADDALLYVTDVASTSHASCVRVLLLQSVMCTFGLTSCTLVLLQFVFVQFVLVQFDSVDGVRSISNCDVDCVIPKSEVCDVILPNGDGADTQTGGIT